MANQDKPDLEGHLGARAYGSIARLAAHHGFAVRDTQQMVEFVASLADDVEVLARNRPASGGGTGQQWSDTSLCQALAALCALLDMPAFVDLVAASGATSETCSDAMAAVQTLRRRLESDKKRRVRAQKAVTTDDVSGAGEDGGDGDELNDGGAGDDMVPGFNHTDSASFSAADPAATDAVQSMILRGMALRLRRQAARCMARLQSGNLHGLDALASAVEDELLALGL